MTLTEAAYWTRRVGVLVAGGLVALTIVIVILISLSSDAVPMEYLQANYACTETKEEFLTEKLEIPSLSLSPGSNLVYEIETETGLIDDLPNIINVHKFNVLGQSLNSQAEAKIIANKLGFNPDAIVRQGSAAYLWNDTTYNRSLTIDATTLNFTLSTDFTKSGALPSGGTLPSESDAIQDSVDFLRGAGLLLQDYAVGTPQATYLNVETGGSFSQASSKGSAELIRVDLYREKPMISIKSNVEGADEMKDALERKGLTYTVDNVVGDSGRVDIYNFDTLITYQDPRATNISVYIGPAKDGLSSTDLKMIYGIEYTAWPIELLSCGTYELIPASVALEMVQNGQGSLVYLNEKNGDDVVPYQPRTVTKFTIFSVNIGYYESPERQSFLQPVYIISGEATLDTGIVGRFHYYVPAISYDLVQDKIVVEEVADDSGAIF